MNKKALFKRLLSYTKGSTKYLVLSIVTSVLSVCFSLLTPLVIGKGIDQAVGPGEVNYDKLKYYIILLGVVIALGGISTWFQNYYTSKLSHKTVQSLRKDIFYKLNEVPISYIDSHSHGDIMSNVINDIDRISSGLLQGFTQLFTGVATILGTLIFMFYLNYIVALIVVLITPVSLLVASFIAKGNHKNYVEQMEYRGQLTSYVEEMVGNIKTVHAYNYEDNSLAKIDEINEPLYKSGVKSHFYSALINPSTRFVNGLVYAAVGVFGAISIVKGIGGELTPGILTSFLSYASQYTKPFNEISEVIAELQAAFAASQRVFDVLDSESLSPDDTCDILENNDGSVEINNVSFSYNPNNPLIEDFNLSVKHGQKIAIVGPTGCGKTTFINLLMRFYDVDSGEIILSDHNIQSLKRKSLRDQYGMVLQESWLFKGTIRENICYGKDDATEEEMIEAAKMSYAHNFIKKLPKGYDTEIVEGGNNISEGQKQLLCITRIMLTKPPMLILDEATSSIDTRTEKEIQLAFEKIMEGRTSFVVAHRLSTIVSSDKIIVMNKGHILEVGTHKELLAKGGFYANIYNSQFDTSN